MTGRPADPQRLCVGCRTRAARSDLLRIVVVEGSPGQRLVPDPRRRLPGRGASLHPDLGCLDLAVRRRVFARALRLAAAPDADQVRQYLQELAAHAPTDREHTPDERSMSTQR